MDRETTLIAASIAFVIVLVLYLQRRRNRKIRDMRASR